MPSIRKARRPAKPANAGQGLPTELHAALTAIGGPLDLAGRARVALEQQIVTLELAPGSVWTEADLSRRLGIGRTPVREALQRLEGDYLVEIVPRLGVRITAIDVQQQLLLLELRRVLERLIAVRAARFCTDEERATCIAIAGALETLRDADVLAFLRHHYNIKRYIAECARNPYVAKAIAPVHAMSRRFYYLHHRLVHDLSVAANHHARVVRAIASGDEARAAAESDRLMDYVEELTRATVLKGL
ncbi:MAG: GntR family transcriptional regulator [Rhodospirillales bacterium]|nr:GntR family transcriptional regulator [Rhodospirillales bacterium]